MARVITLAFGRLLKIGAALKKACKHIVLSLWLVDLGGCLACIYQLVVEASLNGLILASPTSNRVTTSLTTPVLLLSGLLSIRNQCFYWFSAMLESVYMSRVIKLRARNFAPEFLVLLIAAVGSNCSWHIWSPACVDEQFWRTVHR